MNDLCHLATLTPLEQTGRVAMSFIFTMCDYSDIMKDMYEVNGDSTTS